MFFYFFIWRFEFSKAFPFSLKDEHLVTAVHQRTGAAKTDLHTNIALWVSDIAKTQASSLSQTVADLIAEIAAQIMTLID